MIALRQRILIAIELIEEGSKSVSQIFSTLFFPVFPFVMHVFVIFVRKKLNEIFPVFGKMIYFYLFISSRASRSWP